MYFTLNYKNKLCHLLKKRWIKKIVTKVIMFFIILQIKEWAKSQKNYKTL